MTKTEKKLDKQIREILTDVCDSATETIQGFEWLTHAVNYSRFPASLKITCVFNTIQNLEQYRASNSQNDIQNLIFDSLKSAGIILPKAEKQIQFDTEEACEVMHGGNWARRL
ncbi:MAG: Fis family transcriptional regulator [Vibrio gallaecicus]|uniref:Fis family transcriptional regulator n=1 Tax=Vibrio gallaecicus TaxID=552386 RepID=A0ABV4NEP9_9VIBR